MSLAPKCFAPKCILRQNVSRQSVFGSKMFHTQVYPAPKCLGTKVSLAPKCLSHQSVSNSEPHLSVWRPTVPGDKVDWLLNVLAPK